jgi:hypothetical protein
MSASYTVQNIAELEVTPKNPKDTELGKNVTEILNGADFGNLGIIRVKTNATAWDVQMTALDSGKLTKVGSPEDYDYDTLKDWITGVYVQPLNITATPKGSQKRLLKPSDKFVSGSTDSCVYLDVSIGVAKTGAALGVGTQSVLYPLISGTNTFATPIKVGRTHLEKPVSFADSIGHHYAVSGNITGDFASGIRKSATGRATWSNISSDGFPTPQDNYVPDEEYFYVNVGGIHPDSVGANPNGTYKSTFKFDLKANF